MAVNFIITQSNKILMTSQIQVKKKTEKEDSVLLDDETPRQRCLSNSAIP